MWFFPRLRSFGGIWLRVVLTDAFRKIYSRCGLTEEKSLGKVGDIVEFRCCKQKKSPSGDSISRYWHRPALVHSLTGGQKFVLQP